MRKMLANASAAWMAGTFRKYVKTLLGTMSWRVALALVLMFLRSAIQGAQLLLLIPLMQLVGLDVQQGSVGWFADLVTSAFAAVGIRLTLLPVLGAFMLFTTTLALITRWQTTYNVKLEEDFVASLRERLYLAIANTSWVAFSRSRASDFTHALTTELDRVGAATVYFLNLITNTILVSVYVLLALRLSVVMTVLVFVSGAGLLVLLRGKNRAARWTGEDVSLVTNGLYSAAIEHLSGMKTVKSYGLEERSAETFSKLATRVGQTKLSGVRNYAETSFWFSVGSVAILSAILFVSFEILDASAAKLLLLLFLFNRIIPMFNGIQRSFQEYLNALPAFAGVMELQAYCERTAEPRYGRSEETELRHGLRFENVSFTYGEGEAPAIRDLDFEIEAGKTTAIVGPSGAGKSTVADLIISLISPGRGRVLVDGVPLDAGRTRSWRRRIGYVTQDTFLFNDTVKANLLWACPGASDEEIGQALRLAAADEFVARLPNGMETHVGDRGVRLSGGEGQRLALARALLRRPALLILDEATSALDSENERRIQSAIERLHGSMTIVLITHRLSTIREADVIHVLEKGRLVETGDWATLTEGESGRFSSLCRAQGVWTAN